ncbi:MAG: hypothetical protein C3F06_11510 [Candidatus Methanoperedenaceae archaeon]|nr:MAG: hypothetical protein C3F06_11510 [Candidatus Methanoperedenaceae archaeon]
MEENNKQAISKLKRTVRFFEALLRASADGIVITDTAKNIIFVNDTFCGYFSRNFQDVIETNIFVWLEKQNHNAQDIWNGMEKQVKEHGIARDVEFRMKTKEDVRYFSVDASPLERVDIEEAGLIITIWRDDTQRKVAENDLQRIHHELEMRVKERTARLQESEEKYRRLFDYSNDIIVLVDKFGKVLAVNNKVKEKLGFEPQEVIGKNFVNIGILGVRDLPRIANLFKKTAREGMARNHTGRYLDKVEMELRSRNGNSILVETSTTALEKDGKIEGFLTNIRDITQHKQSEEFASRRNRQLRILSTAGQKINTVLEIPAIMQNLVASAIEITDSTAGTVGMIANEKMVFSKYYEHGKLIPIDYVFEKGYGVPGLVMETKKPYLSNDAEHDPYVIQEIRKTLGFTNLANVPILDKNGDILGSFQIHNTRERRPFDQMDIEMLQGLASSAAIAIENTRMMDEIRRSEQDKKTLSSILDKSLNEIYMFDAETLRFTYVNSGACKNLGYSMEEMVSMTPLDLKKEYDEKKFRKLIKPLVLHDKNKIIFFTIQQRRDGSQYPVEVHLQLIEMPKRVFLAMIIDITERLRTEKELNLSEEKFRTLYETMAQGVVYQDPSGKIIDLNPAAQKILGLSANQLIGHNSIDPGWKAIHEDGSSFPIEMHPSMIALHTRKEKEAIMGIFNPVEKQYKWIMVHAVPQFRYAETKPFQVYTTFDDITGIKTAEDEIRSSNEELMVVNRIISATTGIMDMQQILDSVLDESLSITGLEGGMIFLVNPDETLQIAAHIGISEARIQDLTTNRIKIGECLCGAAARDHKSLILPDREAVRKFVTREVDHNEDIRYHAALPLITGGKCVGVLCVFTRTDMKPADKKIKFLEIVSTQVALSIENARLYKEGKDYVEKLENKVKERTLALQENQMSLLNLVDDMNRTTAELESANERLLELDRMKSMFIASTSHELRTPLNSIIGFTSILLEGWSGKLTPEQKEQVQIVNTSGKHLLSLINDVIDISKVEAGKLEVHVSRFKLKEVLDEVVSTLKPELNGKGLLLRVDAADMDFNTDRKRLLQCLMNLLSNAVKFTENGEIKVRAKSINDEIEISVEDTGIGMKKEDIPKLFNAFVRLDSPLTNKTSGTGLGLYLTQKLAKEVLMGTIKVESEYGKGSIFSLQIPREVKI